MPEGLAQQIDDYCHAHPYRGDRTKPALGELLFHRDDEGQFRFLQPIPERMYAALELLDSPLILGLKFDLADGVLTIEDSQGAVLRYQALWLETPWKLVAAFDLIKPALTTDTTEPKEHHDDRDH